MIGAEQTATSAAPPGRRGRGTRPRRHIGVVIAPLAVSCMFVFACEEELEPPPEPDVEQAAEHSALGLEGDRRAARFVGPFQPADALAELDPDEARSRALQGVAEIYRAVVQDVDCLDVESDDDTFVELHLDDCHLGVLGLFRLDGTIGGELDIELEACDGGECPAAVVYAISVEDFVVRARGETEGLGIEGAWTFRAPIGADGAMELDGEVTYTSAQGERLAVLSDVEWSVDGPCLHLSSDARIHAYAEDGELLGGLVASAQDVEACGDACPSAGTVRLSLARGDVLEWVYTGENVVDVREPGGEATEVALECDA